MAFTESERKNVEEKMHVFMKKHRPPVHLRDEMDLAYRIEDQSVEIFEIRPFWKDPTDKIEEPVAKARYVRTQNIWKIFWQRADLKWHFYEPDPEVDTFDEFLKIVEADEFACFWG